MEPPAPASDAAAPAAATEPAPAAPSPASGAAVAKDAPTIHGVGPAVDMVRAAREIDAARPLPPKNPTGLRRRLLQVVGLSVVVVVLALVLPLVGHRLAVWWKTGGIAPPVVYALAHVVPTEPCMQVSINEMRNGTAVFGTVNLRNVRASLYHHLQYGPNGPLQGISAQYLERHRICYALINMIYKPDDPPNLVEMVNMRVIGMSLDRRVRNTEQSILCAHPYETRRFQDVTIEYWTTDGVRRMLDVFGVAAQTIQQVDDVQTGSGYCQDSNLEVQVERVHRIVTAQERRPTAADAFVMDAPRLPQRAQ